MLSFFKRKPKGPATVCVQPLGVEVEVPQGQSILQAVLEAGYDFPHSCKVGTCMSCRCRLISGKVNAIRDFSYVLSGEELRGVISSLAKQKYRLEHKSLSRWKLTSIAHTMKS